MKFIIIIISCLFLFSCQTTQNSNLDDAPSKSEIHQVGECRVGILGKNHKNNLILVNESNKKYLHINKQEDEFGLISTTGNYTAKELSLQDQTSVTIVEDIVMAKVLSLLKGYRFYTFAQSCDISQFQDPQWPVRESLFLEQNGKCKIFIRDEKMIDDNKKITDKGKTYRTLKSFILQAQATGRNANITTKQENAEQILRQNQQAIQQNFQHWENKK
ncbi:MAG: hypothetical protein KBC30_02105 [Planctomycetes bacterium]|nr:hypothetical protein [Planctomycetota bacterium]HON45695.1 hypothetical protein [Planctomycetota bacterium]HRU51446.1 hypothetical protein [Planctomycetota bacterium]